MLELIGTIVLVYYLVMGVVILFIFLAWGCIDDRREAKRRRCAARSGSDPQDQSGREPVCGQGRQGEQDGRLPENVVKFRRGN